MTRLIFIFSFLIYFTNSGFSQKKPLPVSDSIIVQGEVAKPFVINASVLSGSSVINIGDVVIKNHMGKPKDTVTNVKGILLRDILIKVELNEKDPKKFSEFYIVFIATDGYKVVYSWNELFNSPTGNNTFIVTEKDGQSLAQMKDRIAIITTSDMNTGRRFSKAVATIEVKRVP